MQEPTDQVGVWVDDDDRGRVVGLEVVQDQSLDERRLAGPGTADHVGVTEPVLIRQAQRH